jgi:RTX calcium-binding nonapeptide repeat (4 copies)
LSLVSRRGSRAPVVHRVAIERTKCERTHVSLVCKAFLAALLAGVGFGASAASAATVSVTLHARFQLFNEVRYVAAPGERNDLTAHYAADALSVTITDPGARITAMGSCASLSTHSAVCRVPSPPFPVAGPYLQSVRALLGDMNDRAITTHQGPFVIGGIRALGGPGDDVLTGSPAEDVLDGGGGTDLLTGGEGGDMLTDGDRTGGGRGLGPDADMLDGGPGLDTLSYRHRTRGVAVDLASEDPVGERGERDIAPGFESVTGGKGNDRLAGDGDMNFIDGGGGSNLLTGREGDDVLAHASGHTVRCGRGIDAVTRPRARTRVAPSCERLSIRLPRDASVDVGASVSPIPRRKAATFGFDLSCPELDGYPENCRATARIVSRSNHLLLATGRLDDRDGSEDVYRFLSLRLTALGRRLEGDDRRQLATIVIRGPLMARTAWTIGF